MGCQGPGLGRGGNAETDTDGQSRGGAQVGGREAASFEGRGVVDEVAVLVELAADLRDRIRVME